ncbi:short-chain dehydrogenase [Pyricularia oryzae 70-15]|uniref:Short-chain dehydrogenase n=1 Tax=Pyricularia oryzae (strain 70-15 / ATCC MYA-4617 / FGSC 8958) TaxID=242507 RepID=G4NLW7_PYRO7|nr:short-chain dehydrogenase [Pyricularia oryzae 70-15]EHA46170.1 short-chain dehydrogenase [Pyricularia oryzae 70-15]
MASKVVIITGASRGIGLAVAQHLLQANHKVVLVARTEDKILKLKEQYPNQVAFCKVDLGTKEPSTSVITESAIKTFGQLDGLVLNHGTLEPLGRLENAKIDEWIQAYNTNLFSCLSLIKDAIPHLRKTKGRIVFTSSGAALKVTLHGALEEPDVVSVSVGPGRVDTDMQKLIRETGKGVMADKDYAGFQTAFEEGRLNKPEWPAQVMAQLVLEAKPELSGKYATWDSETFAPYRE